MAIPNLNTQGVDVQGGIGNFLQLRQQRLQVDEQLRADQRAQANTAVAVDSQQLQQDQFGAQQQAQQQQQEATDEKQRAIDFIGVLQSVEGQPKAFQDRVLMSRVEELEAAGRNPSNSLDFLSLDAQGRAKMLVDAKEIAFSSGLLKAPATEVVESVGPDGQIIQTLRTVTTGAPVADLGISPQTVINEQTATKIANQEQGRIRGAVDAATTASVKAASLADKRSKTKFDKAKAFREEVSREQKMFKQLRDAFDRAEVSANQNSPAGDLALVFNFMKMLDPGSVVRESEFKTAADAKAWLGRSDEDGLTVPNKIRSIILKAREGQILLPEQRKDFVETSSNLFKSKRKRNDTFRKKKVAQGKRFGLEEADIFLVDLPEVAVALETNTAPTPEVTASVLQITPEDRQAEIDELISRASPEQLKTLGL